MGTKLVQRSLYNPGGSLLLLLLSRFSRVRLCVTLETAAHWAPPSLGFSRQEHWSGLPFSSPMHESKKWKWSRSHVRLLVNPWTAAYQAPPSMGFSRQEYWSRLPLPSPKLIKHKSLQTRYILLRYFANLGANSKVLTLLNCTRLISLCISLKYSVIG